MRRRAAGPVRAVPGVRISEGACLSHVRRLHDKLRPWQDSAAERLPTRPALCADETGMRVNGRNRRLHVIANGRTGLKFLHDRRGREALDAVGVIPRHGGCACPRLAGCDGCAHALCGARLPR